MDAGFLGANDFINVLVLASTTDVYYDLDNNYVHRIRRTSRAGMKGESFTFIIRSGEDTWKTMGIVEKKQKTDQFVTRPLTGSAGKPRTSSSPRCSWWPRIPAWPTSWRSICPVTG